MKNTWIELNPEILIKNIQLLQNALGSETEIILVVKSNAYGHGMGPVVRHAWETGVRWFAVAYAEEALAIRHIYPDAKILILGSVKAEDINNIIDKDIIPVLVNKEQALSLADAVGTKTLKCHVKIDTGMGRLGFDWEEEAECIAELAQRKEFDICGICTHFASSGSGDRKMTKLQAERFNKVLSKCSEKNVSLPFKHVSNSGGVLNYDSVDFDGVRPGILIYGYNAQVAEGGRNIEVRPFLQWKTRVVMVKKVPADFSVSYDSTYKTKEETCIATIDVGYADGYPRNLSNKGFVIIGGKRCPVVGRVTMNLTMVDIGLQADVKAGDEVVLIGEQGEESIWADEVAELCDTISYEVLTNIKADERKFIFPELEAKAAEEQENKNILN